MSTALDIRAAVAQRFEEMTAEDLEHLLCQKRMQAQRAAERREEEIAERAERRRHWREMIPDRPVLGAFDQVLRLPAPPPRVVIERTCELVIADDLCPLRNQLAALANHFVGMGARGSDVEQAFATVLER